MSQAAAAVAGIVLVGGVFAGWAELVLRRHLARSPRRAMEQERNRSDPGKVFVKDVRLTKAIVTVLDASGKDIAAKTGTYFVMADRTVAIIGPTWRDVSMAAAMIREFAGSRDRDTLPSKDGHPATSVT